MLLLRFTMRAAAASAEERARQYRTALDMCAWAEPHGATAILSEHHGVDGGYLPSPVPFAASVASVTSTMPVVVAALLLSSYEPVKLAEDLAVVDHVSRGRVAYVVGVGYRDEDFTTFGVDRARRGALVEERIVLLRRLWSGDVVDVDGRAVRVTPAPYTAGGPPLLYGGGSEAAARRAGRLGLFFFAETHDRRLEAVYLEAARTAGAAPVGCSFPAAGVPLTAFVADDPDRAWADIGEYLLEDARLYAAWHPGPSATASLSRATSVAELRAEDGAYRILTPEQARAVVAGGAPLALQPLVSGLPPERAWPYLEAAVAALG